jgi:2-polyprenyl-3-methyl-5-hydroxy-6-metoxy-1,4-benzoquinol methylase
MEVPATGNTGILNRFEKLYLAARKKEKRVYSDEEVIHLPAVEKSHQHFREWQARNRSARRLINYLQKKSEPLKILEVGCGNGWLSAMLAEIKNAHVTGIDISGEELKQAKRVFAMRRNLSFEQNEINRMPQYNKYDVIVFAAAIQYFPSFEEVIAQAFSLLRHEGEIHILDTHFYKQSEIAAAKSRTINYYASIGQTPLAEFYFHHSLESLKKFRHAFLFNPHALRNRLSRKKDPFPWIRIMNK